MLTFADISQPQIHDHGILFTAYANSNAIALAGDAVRQGA
jgi:hypothetical protein